MSKWVLIEVENQDINEPNTYDTHKEAYDEMERRYTEILEDGDEAYIDMCYASIQTNNYNVDWRIYEVTI